MDKEVTYESEKTHPGFTIFCTGCGNFDVMVENSLGYSCESGGWGSVDLVCNTCDNRTEIVES